MSAKLAPRFRELHGNLVDAVCIDSPILSEITDLTEAAIRLANEGFTAEEIELMLLTQEQTLQAH